MLRRSTTIPLLAATLSLAIPAFVFAQSVQEWEGQMAAFPIGNDLYVVGGNVLYGDDVAGDLVVAGGNVRVTGNVKSDVLAAGGQINIDGNVDDDVRAAGGTIRVRGRVLGDLIVTGGSVILERAGSVQGSVVVFGGDIDINGTVAGRLKVGGGDVSLTGSVGSGAFVNAGGFEFNGTVRGRSEMIADHIRIGPNARLQGTVEYWTEDGEIDFSQALQGGSGATFNTELARENDGKNKAIGAFAAILGIWGIFSLVSSALLLFVLTLLIPRMSRTAGLFVKARPWMSLLLGAAYFAATPALIVFLFITLIGIPLAIVLITSFVASLILASVVTALVTARWIEAYLGKKWSRGTLFLVAFLVLIGLKALWLIPFIGWIVKCALVAMAFGAVIHTKWNLWKTVG